MTKLDTSAQYSTVYKSSASNAKPLLGSTKKKKKKYVDYRASTKVLITRTLLVPYIEIFYMYKACYSFVYAQNFVLGAKRR